MVLHRLVRRWWRPSFSLLGVLMAAFRETRVIGPQLFPDEDCETIDQAVADIVERMMAVPPHLSASVMGSVLITLTMSMDQPMGAWNGFATETTHALQMAIQRQGTAGEA